MDTGRGVVGNEGTASACNSPVVFSAKPRIPLSPWPTTYMNAKVGAVELLLDPRQPLKRATISNKVMVKTAFIRCFLILKKWRCCLTHAQQFPALSLASCKSV